MPPGAWSWGGAPVKGHPAMLSWNAVILKWAVQPTAGLDDT